MPGYAKKSAEQAARIAGVLTMWRDLHAIEVTPADIANGIALGLFHLFEAVRMADAPTLTVEIDRADALRKWMLGRWAEPEIMVRDLERGDFSGLDQSRRSILSEFM